MKKLPITLHFESKSPMLPAMDIKTFLYQLSEEHTKSLVDVVLEKQQFILDTTPISDGEQDPTWLTGRLWFYNFLNFDDPCVHQLEEQIIDGYKQYMESISVKVEPTIYVQCWANIIKNDGRKITKHNHCPAHSEAPEEYSYVSGNICLQAENTATYYGSPFNITSWKFQNNPGDMILFPSFVYHWTDTNTSENLRISLAFDIITPEVYSIVNNPNFKKLTVYE
jgi:oxalate decarboxylase/phosphoglucose isomerase-like protein (cupin superfamily)